MKTDRDIRNALRNLPKGIDETYVRMLEKIRRENPEQITQIIRLLEWLTASKTPLTVEELAHAIAVEPGDQLLDFDAIATDPMDILLPCSCLINLTPVTRSPHLYNVLEGYKHYRWNYGWDLEMLPDVKTSQVGFAHYSIKEFLVSDRIRTTAVAEFFIGDSDKLETKLFKICISYL